MQRIIVILTCLLLILSIRFWLYYQNQPQYKDGEYVSFTATLLSEPRIVGSQQRISANLASGERVTVIVPLIPEFHYGDKVAVSGPIRILPRDGGFQPRAPEERSYRASTKNNIVLIYFPKIRAVKHELAIIGSVRQKLISMFSESLPTPSSSLLLGIVFGIKEPMPKDFTDNLRTSGVMHVIAASGMNVTLIGGFISSLLVIFLKRQLALVISIIVIMFYAVLAGLEPSIVRASIMGILVFSSQILGRQNMARNGLLIAGFMMLFMQPYLLSDVGFQLSFAATLGLLYIRPLFEHNKKLKGVIKKSLVGSDVTTTISAQLATLPILLANFGTYSAWSVLANGLVLWTIPVIMTIGAISAIFGLVFMPLGGIFLYLSYPFLLYFEKIVNLFGAVNESISIQELSWPIVIGYYSMLMACVLFFRRKRVNKK